MDAPGNCTGVLAVAGLRNVGTKVGYSSLGPEVGIAAPAGNCVTSSGACAPLHRYHLQSGTDHSGRQQLHRPRRTRISAPASRRPSSRASRRLMRSVNAQSNAAAADRANQVEREPISSEQPELIRCRCARTPTRTPESARARRPMRCRHGQCLERRQRGARPHCRSSRRPALDTFDAGGSVAACHQTGLPYRGPLRAVQSISWDHRQLRRCQYQ